MRVPLWAWATPLVGGFLPGLLIAIGFHQAALAANPPPVLTVPTGYNLELSWGPITAYQNGAPLPGAPWYKLYSMDGPAPGFLGYVLPGSLVTHRLMSSPGTRCFAIDAQVYDPGANEGDKSTTLCVLVQDSAPKVPAAPSPVCAK